MAGFTYVFISPNRKGREKIVEGKRSEEMNRREEEK